MKSKLVTFLVILFTSHVSVFSQSKIWGITNEGGSGTIGTVYNTDNNGSNQTLLNEFAANNAGSRPFGDLIEVNGKLYGLTSEGGNFNQGVIFSFDLANQQYTKLYDFDGNKFTKLDQRGPVPPLNGSFSFTKFSHRYLLVFNCLNGI
jgi:uncharacterized repeat protein (TIGR03803 family)